MRVLTATSATQGDRPDDCCWTTEGELVSLPVLECSCPDCGCDRSFAGLDSHRSTTTCAVAEVPLAPDDLERAVVRSLAAAGWLVDLDLDTVVDPCGPGDATDPADPSEPAGRVGRGGRSAAGRPVDPGSLDAVGTDGPAGEVVETWDDLHRLVDPPLSAVDRELVDDVVTRIVEVAESFPPGTVLARADGGVVVRRPAP